MRVWTNTWRAATLALYATVCSNIINYCADCELLESWWVFYIYFVACYYIFKWTNKMKVFGGENERN